MRITAKFVGDISTDALLRKYGLEERGRVQQFIDKRVIDYVLPYWAWNEGTLARSAYTATDFGSGLVVYPGPYAHYMYVGEVYGPNIPVFDDNTGKPTRFYSPPGQPKHPTGRAIQYKTDKHPKAGKNPIGRMKTEKLNDLLEEVRRFALDQ